MARNRLCSREHCQIEHKVCTERCNGPPQFEPLRASAPYFFLGLKSLEPPYEWLTSRCLDHELRRGSVRLASRRLRYNRLRVIMFQFLAFAHESGAIEDHQERAARVHRRGPNRWHFPKRGQGHTANNKGYSEEEVLVDHRARAVGELHQEWQSAQVVVHQRNSRAMNGHFAARGAHGDADVASGQRGRIVYAITDDSYFVALGLHGAHELDLILWQTFAFGLFTANLAAHARRDRLAIARNHRDAPDATFL